MSNAVDTDILVYAHNTACSLHEEAKSFVVRQVLASPDGEFVITHQTLFELFSVLTSQAVFPTPLQPETAWDVCRIYLEHPTVQKIAYEPPVIDLIAALLKEKPQRGKRFFDLKLAATLRYHGVTGLYTNNVRHFRDFGFLRVENPLRADQA